MSGDRFYLHGVVGAPGEQEQFWPSTFEKRLVICAVTGENTLGGIRHETKKVCGNK